MCVVAHQSNKAERAQERQARIIERQRKNADKKAEEEASYTGFCVLRAVL